MKPTLYTSSPPCCSRRWPRLQPRARVKLHTYVTAGDPNIGRAFRIAVGDIASNLAPLDGAAALTAAPLNKKRWEALSAKVVEIAGTRDVIPERPSFLIAGLDYGMYQFDTMMHAWDGASFLAPDAVKGALFNTLVMSEDGHVRSGDFITGFGWTVGAWEHYLHTGDRAFLKVALAATQGSFAHYERMEFDPQLGLFRGPAILCDGISSYPDFWVKGLTGKGHIVKWPENHPDKKAPVGLGLPMHALSTQCINYQAYLIAAKMQRELGLPVDPALEEKAARLKAAINKHFWREDAGLYRYLVDPFGGSDQQEGFGNTFAILFGIASPEQTKRVLAAMHVTPHGIPINWPVYPPLCLARWHDLWQPQRHALAAGQRRLGTSRGAERPARSLRAGVEAARGSRLPRQPVRRDLSSRHRTD